MDGESGEKGEGDYEVIWVKTMTKHRSKVCSSSPMYPPPRP